MKIIYKILFFILLFILFTSCYTYSKRILRIDNNWKKDTLQNYLLYYKPLSKTDKNLPKTKLRIDSAIAKAKKKAQVFDFKKPPFHLFILENQKDFIPFEKIPYQGLTYAKSNTILVTQNFCSETHEYFHLLSIQQWGETKVWIKEGSATFSDEKFHGKNVHSLCHYLFKENKLMSFDSLFSDRKFVKNSYRVSYPQSGSLVSYIIEKYGFDIFLQVWKAKNIKPLHISKEKLKEDWILFIQKYPTNGIKFSI